VVWSDKNAAGQLARRGLSVKRHDSRIRGGRSWCVTVSHDACLRFTANVRPLQMMVLRETSVSFHPFSFEFLEVVHNFERSGVEGCQIELTRLGPG